MPVFKYTVMDENGKQMTRTEDALSIDVLEQRITNDGEFLVDYSESETKVVKKKEGKVDPQDLIEFFTFFELLLNSGISVVMSLKLFCSDTRESSLKTIIREISKDIEDGTPVGKAFGKYKAFAGEIEYILTAGEKSGELDGTLKTMHEYLNWKETLRKHIVSVSIYPIVVMSLVFVIIMGLFTFIIPQFSEALAKLGGELPPITQTIMNISDFIRINWMIIIGTMVFSSIAYKTLQTVKEFRDYMDVVKLKIPILGEISNMISQSKFIRNFHIMHTSGIPVLENLELSSKLTGSSVFEKKINNVREQVKEGTPLVEAFTSQNAFSFIVLKMIEAGEETGNLDETLKHVNKYYNSEIPYKVDKMIKIFEFLTIIILGLVVLLVGISLFLPMLDIIGEIKK